MDNTIEITYLRNRKDALEKNLKEIENQFLITTDASRYFLLSELEETYLAYFTLLDHLRALEAPVTTKKSFWKKLFRK